MNPHFASYTTVFLKECRVLKSWHLCFCRTELKYLKCAMRAEERKGEKERERENGRRITRGKAAVKAGQEQGGAVAWSRHRGGRTFRGTRLAASGQCGTQSCLAHPLHATLTRPCWQTFWCVSIWGTRIFRILQRSPFCYWTVIFLKSQPHVSSAPLSSTLQG